ncbi:hypothetical protein BDK63_001299 [Halomonas campaniensis]|uniref:DUF3306 domain-containing protein n=1 Tax=Halomonas campaniensis TaxID=213554 RepID=A0A7W5K1W0_9GAMM|nr:DUF3306 domain-containing protein [Halomonas campaniensis]MBB3330433.1 hypothetical protein [Halomonas campaniensis]
MSRLERWSRRKLGDELEEEAPAEGAVAAREEAEPPAAAEPEPGSLDATLPDPEDLPAGSDFTAFLQAGVSDGLRRRALRRMFSGDHYGIRDGLDDYDDDYRQRLKPLAGELAQRLRQWTRRVEEEEPQADAPADEASAEAQGPDTASANDDSGDRDDRRLDESLTDGGSASRGEALDQG